MLLQHTLLLTAVLSGLISCSAEHQQALGGVHVPEKRHPPEEQLAGPSTVESWGSAFSNQVRFFYLFFVFRGDGTQCAKLTAYLARPFRSRSSEHCVPSLSGLA